MSAWVAAIRPGFASLLNNFLDRKPYSTGVKALDDLLEDSFHYLLYQESIMKFLVWLGMEEKNTYDIIKKISKKKFTEEELIDLQNTLEKGWIKNVGTSEGFKESWQVVQDAAHYSFNASHSLSVAIDSLYGAYLKANYPLEYYSVALTEYADDMPRTSKLVAELPYFNITLKNIKFGKSGADYTMDKENNCIYKGIESIKYCNRDMANELLELSKNHINNFIDLLDMIKDKTSVNNKQLKILIGLNFFSEFGNNKYLLKIVDLYFGIKKESKIILPSIRTCSTISKNKIDSYIPYGISDYIVKKFSGKETQKQYRNIDNDGLLNSLLKTIKNEKMCIQEQISFELDYLGYTSYANPKMSDEYYAVVDFKTYNQNSTRPYLILHNLNSGEEIRTRIKQGKIYANNPFGKCSILKIQGFTMDHKTKFINGKYTKTDELEQILEEYEIMTH